MSTYEGSSPFPERFNLAHYFLDARVEDGKGDRIAVTAGERSQTYREVQRRANRVASALRSRDIGSDDRVLLLLHDGFEFVECWFGVLKVGAVFCMANPLLGVDELCGLLEYTGARAVVATGRTAELLAPAMARYPRCRVHIAVGAESLAELDGWERWEDVLASGSEATANADTLADDVAGWLFTSGTTGRPKGAVHLHRHFAFSTEMYGKRTLGLTENDVFVSVSRLFFGYGTGTNLMFPFAVSGKAVLFSEKPTPELLFDHIERHKVTVLTSIPAMVRQMVDHPRNVELSSLRMCLSAGEALPKELYVRWKHRWPHAELLDGIGSAEMFHIYVSNRLGDVVPGSLGRLVDGYRARIVDADGHDVPAGEVGRLWVAGDSTAMCYWRRQDESRATFHGEWCITADLFRRDERGYFYYSGRADDMLKVRGQFVSPLEVEECLATHAAVRECAVAGEADAAGLTVPKAFVVVREGVQQSTELERELQEYVRARLASHKCPRTVEFVAALPRNDRGKVVRRILAS